MHMYIYDYVAICDGIINVLCNNYMYSIYIEF